MCAAGMLLLQPVKLTDMRAPCLYLWQVPCLWLCKVHLQRVLRLTNWSPLSLPASHPLPTWVLFY